jgi:hypothetical protein
MQTFMPYDNFYQSARCLDRQRLGKQRVECKQLLLALGVPVGENTPKKSSWASHPAARMWKGYEGALAAYGWLVCMEWRDRGYRDTLAPQLLKATANRSLAMPAWLGDEAFHAAHRSNLLRKLPQWYGQFNWNEPDNLPYVWPAGTAVAV